MPLLSSSDLTGLKTVHVSFALLKSSGTHLKPHLTGRAIVDGALGFLALASADGFGFFPLLEDAVEFEHGQVVLGLR